MKEKDADHIMMLAALCCSGASRRPLRAQAHAARGTGRRPPAAADATRRLCSRPPAAARRRPLERALADPATGADVPRPAPRRARGGAARPGAGARPGAAPAGRKRRSGARAARRCDPLSRRLRAAAIMPKPRDCGRLLAEALARGRRATGADGDRAGLAARGLARRTGRARRVEGAVAAGQHGGAGRPGRAAADRRQR